jgi:hypothetical protein
MMYRMQNPERVRTYGTGAASPSSLVLEVYRALRGGSRPTWSNWRLGVDGYAPYGGTDVFTHGLNRVVHAP